MIAITSSVEESIGAPTAGTSSSRRRLYPWIVFGLAFALLLSDYMSRQVLSAVFPFLKADWSLTDSQLASLTSVVALMVGLLTLPISILADRWGRVRSLVLMAVLWSVATLACALAGGYEHMLIARFMVGVGEAAYGSVGIALVLSVFAPQVHAALAGAFMAGGSFGSVVGVSLGGVIATQLGWRWSFAAMAVLGLLLAAAFKVLITERRLAKYQVRRPDGGVVVRRAPFSSLFTNPAVMCAYVGGGLQMFMAAVMLAWLPSFFNRTYDYPPARAAVVASVFVLLIATGMIGCGYIADRLSRNDITGKWTVGIGYCAIGFVCLMAAFRLDTGAGQLALLAIGAFFSAGSSGTTAAMVAGLTHQSVQASGMGTLTLANNLLGLALGPMVVGILADHLGLLGALQWAPLAYLPAAAAMLLGKRLHPRGLAKLQTLDAATTIKSDEES
ncbi:MFS transporter [Antrihabitans cavernicola]|uniref:MFS transporter n=1 Tax=Antrihabitans cavernicola TaxID=2495913 RepID=A0A5A7S3S0_9NOCA|nr:MFS transporter [Spelaeibacter cavernicola]KAA0016518.1 MFS transporter [Spelaeibacter cavernicola]